MDFGKVEPSALPYVDFKLPPDGVHTEKVLSGFKPAANPKFYVGCSKWGRKEWRGTLYPIRTKEAYMLDEYVKHFDVLELNAVFYSIPNLDLIDKWYDKLKTNANPGFLMLPKISRIVSHINRFKDVDAQMELFLENISRFKEFLGPIFTNIPDNFPPKNYSVMKTYIESLPKDYQFFMEIRHEEWFSNPIAKKQIFDLLAEHRVGSIITDTSGRRDCVHMELTVPEAFIRFVGNGSDHRKSDFARVDEWVMRLKEWLDSGLEKVYFIAHQHDTKDSHILAKYIIEQFNAHLGANIPEIILQK